MRWLYLGTSGSPYPDSLRRLEGSSGCYAIRDRESHEVLYVGSSVGKLKKTLTRHLQAWGRSKTFWTGAGFGRQADPGTIYEREGVEVRWWVGRNTATMERRLIATLKPRDNQLLLPSSGGLGLPDLPF